MLSRTHIIGEILCRSLLLLSESVSAPTSEAVKCALESLLCDTRTHSHYKALWDHTHTLSHDVCVSACPVTHLVLSLPRPSGSSSKRQHSGNSG